MADTIVEYIYEHSRTQPQKTAVIAMDHTVDYGTFWNLIAGMATLLKRNGIEKGQRVLLEAAHTVENLVLCYGIHLAGAVHVPIEHNTPKDRVEEISKEIQPSLVLTGKNPISYFDISLMDLLDVKQDYTFPERDMLQDILYTTGTTGKSKGIMETHGAQTDMVVKRAGFYRLYVGSVWLIPVPMNHGTGVRCAHEVFVRGGAVVLINGFKNLKRFFEAIKKYHVNSIVLPPSGLRYLFTLAPKEIEKYNEQLDFILSASAALPNADKEKLISLLPGVRLLDVYGATEVGGSVSTIEYSSEPCLQGCVGRPDPGVEVFIVDDGRNPIESSPDNPGIIAVKSHALSAGYWNEPELTAETMVDGVFYTSDLGYLKDGYLYVTGRRDDVISVGGLKVAPTEVEDVALRHPMVNECVCVPYEDKIAGKIIKLLVTVNQGVPFDAGELTEYLRVNLEAYKVPRYIECVSEIPHTFNGKIDRKKLRG